MGKIPVKQESCPIFGIEMTSLFGLFVMELKTVYDIPELWTADRYRQLLQAADYDALDEIDPADLPDMTVMALQDLKPEEAAEAVLSVLAAGLSAGTRKNMVHEMKEQRATH